jgi:hypothetical protein
MPITISNVQVAANAPTGTTVGVLTAIGSAGNVVDCNFITTKRTAGFFVVSGENLVTSWSGSITPGYYSARVHANGINIQFSATATFTILVAAASPASTAVEWSGSFNTNFTLQTVNFTNDKTTHNTTASTEINITVQTLPLSGGGEKYYWETTFTEMVSNNSSIELVDNTVTDTSTPDVIYILMLGALGEIGSSNIGWAYDPINNQVCVRVNGGSWVNPVTNDAASPTAGTGGVSISANLTSGNVAYLAFYSEDTGEQCTILSTQATCQYTAPDGFAYWGEVLTPPAINPLLDGPYLDPPIGASQLNCGGK